jgi:hypothetical protein
LFFTTRIVGQLRPTVALLPAQLQHMVPQTDTCHHLPSVTDWKHVAQTTGTSTSVSSHIYRSCDTMVLSISRVSEFHFHSSYCPRRTYTLSQLLMFQNDLYPFTALNVPERPIPSHRSYCPRMTYTISQLLLSQNDLYPLPIPVF